MFKDIVTKAVIGKGKKTIKEKREVVVKDNIDNVLGCWVINHTFNGNISGDKIIVNGSYDVNIWYAYDNNSKTNVIIKSFTYQEPMKINKLENTTLNSNSEIIVRSLNQPSVSEVELEEKTIKLTIDKQLGVEVIGNTMVRINVEDALDDYEEIVDEDYDINEEYL